MKHPELKQKFNEIFPAAQAPRLFCAPARVNLIGEHTDYNGGHVFPCALTFNTYVAASKRTDGKIRLYSLNFEKTGLVEADINHLAHDPKQDWANYPLGVFGLYSSADCLLTAGRICCFGAMCRWERACPLRPPLSWPRPWR